MNPDYVERPEIITDRDFLIDKRNEWNRVLIGNLQEMRFTAKMMEVDPQRTVFNNSEKKEISLERSHNKAKKTALLAKIMVESIDDMLKKVSTTQRDQETLADLAGNGLRGEEMSVEYLNDLYQEPELQETKDELEQKKDELAKVRAEIELGKKELQTSMEEYIAEMKEVYATLTADPEPQDTTDDF